jgi:hypothetical protein
LTELPSDPLQRYSVFRENPWLFLKYCVYTQDQVDLDNPIKRYTSHLKYLFFLVQVFMKEKKIALPKSRRMTASWTFIGLVVWDVIFHKGRDWALCSKKEDDARELVSRAQFIYDHIPKDMIAPDLLPKVKNGKMQTSPPCLEFPEINSKVKGFPQGGDQMRQFGFSGILEDECAFQEESEDTYAASEPTIRGGGRMIKISSRSVKDGGFFKKIVFDQLNAKDNRFPEIAPVPVRSPMEGIQVWKNPDNGFFVVDLSYEANPDKRSPEFRESLMKTLPIHQFRMEYEKSWETFEGKPVYQDFNERIHVTHVQPKVLVGLPILLGWDSSGLTPAAVIAQLQEDRLFILREIIGIGMGAAKFVPLVAQTIKLHYPQIHSLETQTINFFDPAGLKKNEITEQTYVQEMIKHGFRQVRPGPMTIPKRVEAVTDFLIGLTCGEPKIQIYEKDCPIIVSGFKGGYRYPDRILDSEPDTAKPLKDLHSHPHDAVQYLCGGLKFYRKENYDFHIPTPQYGFQKHDVTPSPRKTYGR